MNGVMAWARMLLLSHSVKDEWNHGFGTDALGAQPRELQATFEFNRAQSPGRRGISDV